MSERTGRRGRGGGRNGRPPAEGRNGQQRQPRDGVQKGPPGTGPVQDRGPNSGAPVQRGRGGRYGRGGGSRGRGRQENVPSGFALHWSADETAAKLELGQCFRGKFRAGGKGGEAYVTLPGLPQDVMFRKGVFQNRAMMADIVAFRILPVSFWWVQKSVAVQQNMDPIVLPSDEELAVMDGRLRRMGLLRRSIHIAVQKRQNGDQSRLYLPVVWDHVESPDEAKTLISEVLKYFPEVRPTAEVVRIMEESPKRSRLVGVLQADPKQPQLLYLLPTDSCLPKKFIVSAESLKDDRRFLVDEAAVEEKETRTLVKAEFMRWEAKEELPSASVHEILGTSDDIEVGTKALLSSNNVQEAPFSEDVLNSLPSADWIPSEEDLDGRWDFRDKRVFSIDPPTARDIDDALSIERVSDELYKVAVHIADVSHFVKPQSVLDTEAQNRTTSVYLVQRVIPMLPEVLSSHLCSLQPDEDRLAFSVTWEMTKTGEVISRDFGKSIIRSCAKLAYGHAQSAIEDPSVPQPDGVSIHGGHTWEEVKEDILALFELSKILKAQREDFGALRLDLPKICFRLDENGLPDIAESNCQREANHLIQEFMLLANMTVAKFISQTYPAHSLLRMHPPPNLRLMADLMEIAGEMKVELDVTTAATIQRGLWQLYQKCTDTDIADAITNIATRPMQLAEYFCTGSLEKENWKHYALAVDTYTHFTSPIRRYPDIIVHRLLYAAITIGDEFQDQLDHKETLRLQTVADACNKGKTSARNAQDDSVNLYLRYWLEKRPVETLGVVASVKGTKFFDVYVPQFAFSTRILCESLPGPVQAEFDKDTSVLTIQKKKEDDSKTAETGDAANGHAENVLVVNGKTLNDMNKNGETKHMVKTKNLLHDIRGVGKEVKGTRQEEIQVQVDFGYDGDQISVTIHPCTNQRELNDASVPGVSVDLSYSASGAVTLTLKYTDSPERMAPNVPTASKTQDRPSNKKAPAHKTDAVAYSHVPGSKICPLHYPIQISRFSKVPVRVSAKRNTTLGIITDLMIDLIVSDV